MTGLLWQIFLLHLLGTALLVDEDDGAENDHLSTDTQEWPQGSKLICRDIFNDNNHRRFRKKSKKFRKLNSNVFMEISFLKPGETDPKKKP